MGGSTRKPRINLGQHSRGNAALWLLKLYRTTAGHVAILKGDKDVPQICLMSDKGLESERGNIVKSGDASSSARGTEAAHCFCGNPDRLPSLRIQAHSRFFSSASPACQSPAERIRRSSLSPCRRDRSACRGKYLLSVCRCESLRRAIKVLNGSQEKSASVAENP